MAKKFEAPANLAELDAAALEAAVNDAYAAAEELAAIDDAEITDEQLAELQSLDGFISAAKEENSTREAAAAERADALAAIRANLAPAEEAEEVIEGEDDQPTEEKPDGEFAKGKLPEDIADGGADDAEEGPDGKKKVPAKPPVKAAVQRPANLNRSFAARAAKNAPAPAAPVDKPAGARLLSATNTDGFQVGQQFSSLEEAGAVIGKRLARLPKDAPMGTLVQNTALSIVLPDNQFADNSEKFGNQGRDQFEMLRQAGDETRLPGKSLVAAGGWGAPSERSLDFCKLESIEGLIKLPEVSITRGGIEYTKGPIFADILASSTGFWDMTEATAEAGVEQKTFLRPSLPTFTEQRLDAVGVGMEAGLLLRQGWPEVIARYSELLLTAHQYKMAQKTLTQMLAFTGAAQAAGPGFGNALDVLHILELIATGERQRTFMSPNQTLEAVIPHWVKNVIRVDIANRNGVQDFKAITDAQIDSEFAARKMKVQWITAWQNLAIDGTKKIALKYPETVDILLYPAGSFVRGVAPVITLDTIYDSTNLKKNDYVELFVEQGTLVTNPCGEGVHVSLPLYANGRRAIDDIANNFGTAAV